MAHTKYRHAFTSLLLGPLLLLATGCQDDVVIPLHAHERDSSVRTSEYFGYAVENLNRLSEFGPHEILGKIVGRLNQWAKSESPRSHWQIDPLIATLPPEFQDDRLLNELSSETYLPYDGVFLREAVMTRNISDHVCGDAANDLEMARRLFDWTVQNIDLDPEPSDAKQVRAQMPWHSIVFGHGRAIDRAWVFVLLARQQNLNIAILNVPQRQDRPNKTQLWCTALISGGKLYLFDPAVGLPIPGPEADTVATLREVAADDRLLRQLDLEGSPYPISAEQLKNVDLYVEGGRQFLSNRMKNIQTRLTGDQRLVITARPSEIVESLRGIPHLSRKRLWPWPYVAERLFSGDSLSRKAVQQEMNYFERFVTGAVNPLWAGRLQQFAGYYTTQLEGTAARSHDAPVGQQGAKPFYLRARTMMRKFPKEKLPPELKDRIDLVYERADVIKRDASRWLAMIGMDEQNYDLAIYYFTKAHEVERGEKWPSYARRRDINIALARAYEAKQQPEKAIGYYLAVSGPAAREAQLRAGRLAAAAGKKLSDYEPVADEPQPATDPETSKRTDDDDSGARDDKTIDPASGPPESDEATNAEPAAGPPADGKSDAEPAETKPANDAKSTEPEHKEEPAGREAAPTSPKSDSDVQ